MPDTQEQSRQFRWVAKIALAAMIAALAMLGMSAAGSIAMMIPAIGQVAESGQPSSLVPYVLWLVGSLIAVLWVLVAYGLIKAIIANESVVSDADGRLMRIETLVGDQARSIRRLVDLTSLSDNAKGLIYREQELQALHEAIHDDIIRQDYEAADATIEMMEQKLGYVDEAADFREELQDARQATLDEKVDDAISRLQKIIETHNWPRAMRAAQRLMNRLPDHPKTASLTQRVEEARNSHKRQLLQEYGEAVRKNDVNLGIDLLKELDRYLTPQEAAALEESARGVFKAKLHNLGVQFAICVTDQRWNEAMATGEEIVRDFPNSRMCLEVRQKMPQLRELVSEAQANTAT